MSATITRDSEGSIASAAPAKRGMPWEPRPCLQCRAAKIQPERYPSVIEYDTIDGVRHVHRYAR